VWLLDLGNTRLKLARLTGGQLSPVRALPHEGEGLEAALAAALGASTGPVLLASVAAAELEARVRAALEACGLSVHRMATVAECDGLRIAYADPSRLGVDRFLALLAARRRGGDALLVSFGSALTADLLRADGQHVGGMIGIAPTHARRALAERFPALDRGEAPFSLGFAADTPESVAAGVRAQALGFVLVARTQAAAALGHAPRLLLAGGDAAALAPALRDMIGADVEVAEHLVLEGLARLAALA